MKSLGAVILFLSISFSHSTVVCPDILCQIFCTFGNVVVNGCKICECIDPCKDIVCSSPKICMPNPYNCSLDGQCLAKPKCMVPCPAIKCMACPYGYEIDKNGCQTCTCINPCKGHKCKSDEKCEVQPIPCEEGPNCGYKPKCVKKCKELNCPSLDCPYGYEEDCNHCPKCKCRNPCSGVVCPQYYYCYVQTIYCFVAPCPPPYAVCRSYCKNLLFNDYGSPVTCSSNNCPTGYVCTSVAAAKKSYCCSQ